MKYKPTYVVIGASGAIGSNLVERLNRQTANVVAVDRDVAMLEHSDDESLRVVADCNSYQELEQTFTLIQNKFAHIDGVALCVGSILLKPAHLITDTEWADTLQVNLTTAFNVLRAVTKVAKTNCSVVFFSSAAAAIGLPNHEAIAAAKAGVEGLMRSAAASYADKNLRFNCIAPGLVNSNMSEKIFKSPRSLALSLSMHALKRTGTADKIASLAEWLINPNNDWITGETIRVDGGLSTVKTIPKVEQVN